jgi:DNA-binding NtrC family response regulator
MSAHILQVAYDTSLMETRALMLKSKGYKVTSVCGNQQAMSLGADRLGEFDAAVIGFSSTQPNRQQMVQWFKANRSNLRVVVLQFDCFEKFPEADFVSPSEDPAEWLGTVAQCVTCR